MRANGIAPKVAARFVVTTNSRNTLQPLPDLLRQNFNTARPNVAWVSDTTFIHTRQGWLYLATVLDLYSRLIVGWAMGERNNAQLVQDALSMATARRGNIKGVIVHSDQGSTYASKGYQELLERKTLLGSMSRKGECLDNAVAESFFGSLKAELTDEQDYRTRDEASSSIFEYIELFYNRVRRHSYLNYVSPLEYERAHAP